jgi:serine/threonine-protein kinase
MGEDPSGSQAPGTTITLTVSTGSALVTVPDVRNFNAATAEATLTSQGFTYNPVPQSTTDPNQDGIVIKQTPPGNKQAAAGSTVTIYIGNYVASTTTTTTTTTTTSP